MDGCRAGAVTRLALQVRGGFGFESGYTGALIMAIFSRNADILCIQRKRPLVILNGQYGRSSAPYGPSES